MPLSLPAPENSYVMFEKTVEISTKGKWVTVPALEIDGNTIITRGRWIRMALIHDEEWIETDLERPELCVQTLRDHPSAGLRGDIFTFSQKPFRPVPHYSYHTEWDSIATIRMTTFKAWWEALPQETRKNVRRSQKRGVVVRVRELDDDLVREIVDVNNESPMRQGKPFYHYGKTAEQVRKDQSSFLDRSDFICAYRENELIGFLKLVYKGDAAAILQILTKASHQDSRPTNALLAKAVELCEVKGVSCLIYGQFNYGNKGDSPLREFKVRNGFGETLAPRFYVPLTAKGAWCLKLKLHRGLQGILPHRVLTLLVGCRAKWYDFKQLIRRCSSILERPNRNRQMERANPPAGSKFDA
jgi:hypothetical protein